MSRLRKTVSSDDFLVYNDENYLIFKKGGANGTINDPLSIIDIGIQGLLGVRDAYANEADWRSDILDLCEDMRRMIRDASSDSSPGISPNESP